MWTSKHRKSVNTDVLNMLNKLCREQISSKMKVLQCNYYLQEKKTSVKSKQKEGRDKET